MRTCFSLSLSLHLFLLWSNSALASSCYIGIVCTYVFGDQNERNAFRIIIYLLWQKKIDQKPKQKQKKKLQNKKKKKEKTVTKCKFSIRNIDMILQHFSSKMNEQSVAWMGLGEMELKLRRHERIRFSILRDGSRI